MISIKCKNSKGDRPAKTSDVMVTDSKGNEINRITKIDVEILPCDVVRATIELTLHDIELDCEEQMIYKDIKGNKYIKFLT